MRIKIYRPKLCECGVCRMEVKPGRRFISGHNRRGKPKTSPLSLDIRK